MRIAMRGIAVIELVARRIEEITGDRDAAIGQRRDRFRALQEQTPAASNLPGQRGHPGAEQAVPGRVAPHETQHG